MRLPAIAACLAFGAAPALAQRSLPNPLETPGAINPAVNQQNIGATICQPGWALTVSPSAALTSVEASGSTGHVFSMG